MVFRNPILRLFYGAVFAWGVALVLALVMLAIFMAKSPSDALAGLGILAPFFAVYLWVSGRAFSARLVLSDDGVEVRNVWRVRNIPWTAVRSFTVGRDWRGPVLRIRLASGASVVAGAVSTALRTTSQRVWLQDTVAELERVRKAHAADPTDGQA